MPEIEITADQEARLRSLREELARDVVGKYGHVRTRDAIEYLLDRYAEDTDDATTPAGEAVSDSTESAPDSTPTTDASDAGPSDDAETATDASGPAPSAKGGTDGATARIVGEDNGASDSAPETTTASSTEPATAGDAGGDSRLNAMMNLLDTHSEKWGEGSGDERYAVELPDGSTESARTKDDVKALLFKHYR